MCNMRKIVSLLTPLRRKVAGSLKLCATQGALKVMFYTLFGFHNSGLF